MKRPIFTPQLLHLTCNHYPEIGVNKNEGNLVYTIAISYLDKLGEGSRSQ
jgi:hypothetical protein